MRARTDGVPAICPRTAGLAAPRRRSPAGRAPVGRYAKARPRSGRRPVRPHSILSLLVLTALASMPR